MTTHKIDESVRFWDMPDTDRLPELQAGDYVEMAATDEHNLSGSEGHAFHRHMRAHGLDWEFLDADEVRGVETWELTRDPDAEV